MIFWQSAADLLHGSLHISLEMVFARFSHKTHDDVASLTSLPSFLSKTVSNKRRCCLNCEFLFELRSKSCDGWNTCRVRITTSSSFIIDRCFPDLIILLTFSQHLDKCRPVVTLNLRNLSHNSWRVFGEIKNDFTGLSSSCLFELSVAGDVADDLGESRDSRSILEIHWNVLSEINKSFQSDFADIFISLKSINDNSNNSILENLEFLKHFSIISCATDIGYSGFDSGNPNFNEFSTLHVTRENGHEAVSVLLNLLGSQMALSLLFEHVKSKLLGKRFSTGGTPAVVHDKLEKLLWFVLELVYFS